MVTKYELETKSKSLEYYKKVFSKRITDQITLETDENGDFLPDYYWLLNNLVFAHEIFRSICEPTKEFKFGWYFRFFFDFLREIIERRNNYLVINVFPGAGKSTVLMSFICVYLGFFPNTRFLIVSVTEKVRDDYMRDIRNIINSPYYKQLFPNVEIDDELSNNKEEFFLKKFNYKNQTEGGGHILVCPISGNKTGVNSDFTIFDDPVNYDTFKEQKENYIQKTNDVVGGCITRDRGLLGSEAGFILCMQRICPTDPTNFLLNKSNKWKHIKIPVKVENGTDIYFDSSKNKEIFGKYFVSPYRKLFIKNNDFVFPEKFNEEKLQFFRDLLNNDIDFQWQYFQECREKDTKIFHLSCINHYKQEDIKDLQFEKRIISIDSSSGSNDYQSMQLWGFNTFENNITKRKEIKSYLLEVYLSQEKTPIFTNTIIDWCIEYQPDFILVEEASSGIDIINSLEIFKYGGLLDKKDFKKNKYIVGISPRISKEDRARSASTEVNSSRVFFPSEYNKISRLDKKQIYVIKELERELDIFPNSKDSVHDDAVDSLTQALNWARMYFNKNKERRINISYV